MALFIFAILPAQRKAAAGDAEAARRVPMFTGMIHLLLLVLLYLMIWKPGAPASDRPGLRRPGRSGEPTGSVELMHPIERLRYVARASGAPQSALVQETATALASFGSDPAGPGHRLPAHRVAPAHLGPAGVVLRPGPDRGRRLVARSGRRPAQVQADRTAAELAHALPDDATVTVLGWPDEIGEALPRRGDVEVLAVDTRGEASGFVSQLWRADVEATDVPQAGPGRGGGLGQPGAARVAGGRARGVPGRERLAGRRRGGPRTPASRCGWWPAWAACCPAACGTACGAGSSPTSPGTPTTSSSPSTWSTGSWGPAGPEPVADALRRTDCPVAPELFKGDVLSGLRSAALRRFASVQ